MSRSKRFDFWLAASVVAYACWAIFTVAAILYFGLNGAQP